MPGLSEIQSCRQDLMRDMTFPDQDLEERQDRVEGSCAWILKNPECMNWKKKPGLQLLTISGEAGIGKSALAAFLVEQSGTKETMSEQVLAYFFCKNSDPRRNNATAVLRVLLNQLLAREESLFKHLLEGQGRHRERKSACFEDLGTLWNIFKGVLDDPALGNATIIVDGLDEIADQGCNIIDKVKTYVESRSGESSRAQTLHRIGIVFLCQPLHRLDKLVQLRLTNTHCIKITRSDISDDLEKFITEKIATDSSDWNWDLSNRVRARLRGNHEGTFLWVSLFIKHVQQLNLKLDPESAIKEKLDDVPDDLNGVYLRLLREIDRDYGSAAKFILQAVVSGYQLTTVQLAILLLSRHGAQHSRFTLPNDHEIRNAIKLLRSCEMLLVIDKNNVHVPIKLLHGSVSVFLQNHQLPIDLIDYQLDQEKARRAISGACDAYLQSTTLQEIAKDAVKLEHQLNGTFFARWRNHSLSEHKLQPIALWDSVTSTQLALFRFACRKGHPGFESVQKLAAEPLAFQKLRLLAVQQGHKSIVRVLQITTAVDRFFGFDWKYGDVLWLMKRVGRDYSPTGALVLGGLTSMWWTSYLSMLPPDWALDLGIRFHSEIENDRFQLQMIEEATKRSDVGMLQAIVQPADFYGLHDGTFYRLFEFVSRRHPTTEPCSKNTHSQTPRSCAAYHRVESAIKRQDDIFRNGSGRYEGVSIGEWSALGEWSASGVP